MTAWEYHTVLWEATSRGTMSPSERYYVRRRGSTSRQMLPADLVWIDYVNELGGEGWELVAVNQGQSVIFPSGTRGYSDIAAPISVSYIFKRVVATQP